MGCYSKAVLFSDPVLNGPDFIFRKLDDPPAAYASQVAVMLVTIDMFIVEMAVLEIDLLDKAAFDEEGDGPVQGGLGDPLFLVPQPQEELIHVEVVVDSENLLDDRFPLRRVAKPLFFDVFPKFLDGNHDYTIIIEIHFQL